MQRNLSFWIVVFLLAQNQLSTVHAQKVDPVQAKKIDSEELPKILDRFITLKGEMESLPKEMVRDHPEIEIYLKAATWILRHNEFFHADSGKWTSNMLYEGRIRAELAKEQKFPWLEPINRSTSRAYRSKLDGSVQPYAVSYPLDYGKEKGKTYRLDIVLHGRDATLTEVKFLNAHNSAKAIPKDQSYVQIDIYGRGNNAYRWAGESDVWEVVDHFRKTEERLGRGHLLDPNRVVLRGFSMGGAGTWHLGLHHPDKFCVIGPGAGFTTTHGYIKGLPNPLLSPQEECLTIYDAVRYAENASQVPIVAYSGEKDPQKAAAINIEERLRELKINSMTHLIAPGLEHKFPPEWQKKAESEWSKFAGEGKGRNPSPKEIDFVTYTLKYSECDWVRILGLQQHYQRARIHAKLDDKQLRIHTENIQAFSLRSKEVNSIGDTIFVDETKLILTAIQNKLPFAYIFEKEGKQWKQITPDEFAKKQGQSKSPGLQGPIDDAFTNSFVCVTGSRKPYHESTAQFVTNDLQRFAREWDKFFRGTLPIKKDEEITSEDIANKNLILFGDPSSNKLIEKVLEKLPIQWTKDSIEMAGKSYDSSTHIPILIYPNPLNPNRYVVLNSGHTFHEKDFQGTNALLYPRLGDYAILRIQSTDKDPLGHQVLRNGLFKDDWTFPKDSK